MAELLAFRAADAGESPIVTDQRDRELESEDTDDTRYERLLDDEARRRHEAAERLKREPLTEPEPDDR